nr:hypothetical protein Iba_scaffold36840CG0010 [Ipomoea batatas]GMD07527.1 hypothetical protein Iba_chr06cCG8090 [Ipomoea batatas]GMD10488.1 hypothetical protein Iba_chr06eCG6730 [Ipomoea batatas]GMD11835.1 hypothetical protein Iba_chr06fCG7490 [Ipomoea batatas]
MKSLVCLFSSSMSLSEWSPRFALYLLPMTNRTTIPFSSSSFFRALPVGIQALRIASLFFLRSNFVMIPKTARSFFFE